MDRWMIGLIGFFATIFLANGVLVWLATSDNPIQIEESYDDRVGEKR